MGGRFSRVVASAPRVKTPSTPAKTVPSRSEPLPAERSNLEFVPQQEPLEERDLEFEKQLHAVVDRIESEETVFVRGSDPVSAEAKRKERREMRKRMLRGRLTVAHFKEILIQQDAVQDAEREAWLERTAQRYEVDRDLLAQVLRFYRFPKMSKRYDGYLVADPWL